MKVYIFLLAATYATVIGSSLAIARHLRISFKTAQQVAGGVVAVAGSGSKSEATVQQRKRRRLAWQINAILLVQAIIPIVADVLPSFVIITVLTARVWDTLDTPQTTSVIMALESWAAAVSALSVILLVRPYRLAVLSLVFKKQGGGGTSVGGGGRWTGGDT